MPNATCQVCKATYCARADDRSPVCSRVCSGLFRRIANERKRVVVGDFTIVHFKRCCECNAPFVATNDSKRYCSEECAMQRQLRSLRERYIPVPSRAVSCAVCLSLFYSKGGRARYCSKSCQKKGCASGGSHRKRARLAGVFYEPVNKIAVFNRDGWKCQICRKPTPKSKMGTNHPNAPTLDHRIAIANGGAHSYSNIQCACRSCNSVKSAGPALGQLPLLEPVLTEGQMRHIGPVARLLRQIYELERVVSRLIVDGSTAQAAVTGEV